MIRSKAQFPPRITMNTQGTEPQKLKTIDVYVETKASKIPMNNERRSSDVPSNQAVSSPHRSILPPGRKLSLTSALGSLPKSIIETQSPGGSEKIKKVSKTKNSLKKRKKEQYIAEEWITLPNASAPYKPKSKALKKREKKHIREESNKKELTQYNTKKKPTYKAASRVLSDRADREKRNNVHSSEPLQPQFSKRNKEKSPSLALKRKRNPKSDSFLTRKASPLPKTSKKTSLFLKKTSIKDEKKVDGFVDPAKFFQALKVLAKKKRQYHHMEIIIPGSGDERKRGMKSTDLAYQSKIRSGVLLPKSKRKKSGVRPKPRPRKQITNSRESSFTPFTETPLVTAVEYYSKRSTP